MTAGVYLMGRPLEFGPRKSGPLKIIQVAGVRVETGALTRPWSWSYVVKIWKTVAEEWRYLIDHASSVGIVHHRSIRVAQLQRVSTV